MARSILWPQLVYGPYMLRKPSPHTFPATEIILSSGTRNKILESGKPENETIRQHINEAWGFVVATTSQLWEAPWLYWWIVSYEWVVSLHYFTVLAQRPRKDSLHAQMSAPFLVSFPQEWALKQMFNGLMSNFTTHNRGEYPGHRFIPSSIGGVFHCWTVPGLSLYMFWCWVCSQNLSIDCKAETPHLK